MAALAGSGKSVVDMGTDHGYLPVYFAQNGLFDRIAASDINPGPLDSARASARVYGVYDRIGFHLSDGLKSVPGEFETVVIAGMGGETMVDIIAACPWAGSARLILQPQSKVDKLTEYLGSAGFVCESARLCLDAGKLYLAFAARIGEGGFDLIGALLDSRDGLLGVCLKKETDRIKKAIAGMERGEHPDAAGTGALKAKLKRLENILKETEKWQN